MNNTLTAIEFAGFSIADIAALLAAISIAWAALYRGLLHPYVELQAWRKQTDARLEHMALQLDEHGANLAVRLDGLEQQIRAISDKPEADAIQRIERMLSSMTEPGGAAAQTRRIRNAHVHHHNERCERDE